MKTFSKKNIKIAILAVVGLFILFWGGVFSLSALYTYLEEKKQQDFIEELQRPYLEDTYGGATPEETIQLFINALQVNDLELASKYFLIDNQEGVLDELKNNINLEIFLDALINNKKEVEPLFPDTKRFAIYDSNDRAEYLDIVRNVNGIWKITEL